MKVDQILNKAYKLTVTYPYLWLLSFLAIIGGVATEGRTQTNFSVPSVPSEVISDSTANSIGNSLEDFFENISTYIPIILIVVGVVLIIFIALFVIGLIAKSGQIDSIIKDQEDKKHSFSSAFSNGKKYAWRIFLLRIVFSIITLISVLVSIPLIIITLLVFFITIPALLIYYATLYATLKNAEIMIVKHNCGVFESIKKAWLLLKSDWKNILLLWVVQFGVNIGISLAFLFIGIIFIVLTVIVLALFGILIYSSSYTALMPIIFILAGIVVLLTMAVMLFVSSVLHTFFTSYWTIGVNSLLKK